MATYLASIDVDNTITLIGALIAAPEAGLTINAETLVVQVVEEYSREKGFGFSASIPTDRSGDVTQGDGVNAVVGGSVLNNNSDNVLYSMITPGNINIKNGIPANLKRDPNNLRSTPSKHKTYVRVVVPIVDGGQFSNNWKEIRENLFTDKKTPLSIDENTALLEAFLEEKISEEAFNEAGENSEGDIEAAADEVETDEFIVTATVYDESNNEATKDLVENKDREVFVEYVAEGETSSPLFVRNDFVDAASGLPFKKLHIFTGETSDGTETFEDDTNLFLSYNEDTDTFLMRHAFADEDILIEANSDQLLFASEDTWDQLSKNIGLLKEDLKAYFDIYKGLLPQLASGAVGMTPFVGDVKDLNSALTGVDAISGDVLSPAERVVTGTFGSACLAANLLTGGVVGTEMHIAKEGLKLTLKAYEMHQAAKTEAQLLKLAQASERAKRSAFKR